MNLSDDTEPDQRSGYFPSLLLPASVLGGLLVITLMIQLVLSWQAHRRLEPIQGHILQMSRLQDVNLSLQKELLDSMRDVGTFTAREREQLHLELNAILAMQAYLAEDTKQLLTDAHMALHDENKDPKEALIIALSQTRKAIDMESRAHKKLIDTVNRATTLEFQIGVITLVVFPAGALFLLYIMRKRILAPLNHLSYLMTLLGRSDYAPAPIESVDPILRPLTGNYNKMVTRLAALEKEHAVREQELESQVSYATSALLAQQRNLAATERLAAIGETMARIAHELRNPLAGIKLAFTNLRQELTDSRLASDYVERVDMIAAEVDRIIAVLNSLLDQSRHSPEPLQDIVLKRAVSDLVALMQYQISPGITLRQEIADGIVCRLPDAMFRQALLNLILNAQQAIGDQVGEILVKAEIVDGLLRLTVSDDGPGFPQELLQSGVRSFVSHRPEGTGLGLAMVQRFVRSHGGELSLSSNTPRGACVILEFPYEES